MTDVVPPVSDFDSVPRFEDAAPAPRPIRGMTPGRVPAVEPARPAERRRTLLGTIDTPIVIAVGLLLAIGLMMVYSTTFDWSYQDFGDESIIFMQHVRNMGIGLAMMIPLIFIDYRIWRRYASVLLLLTLTLLVGVLLFGDNTFGARRAFFNGSYQPGELAELIIIIYLSAWLGSKKTRIRDLRYGLIPFAVLVGVIAALILRQPDISTAAMVGFMAVVLFFLAGGDLIQLAGLGGVVVAGTLILLPTLLPGYAEERVDSFVAGAADLTQANYHVQQAIIAFINGGWTGVGLGEGRQKFGFLPAPHTDSIFAVIGEELGVVGAALVVTLYVVLVMRGLTVARRAADPFGALMAAGISIWVASKALLNIAVMTAVLPATGAPLPLISFGGSSLVVMMAAMGLLLSVSRVTGRQKTPERKESVAHYDRGGGNGGARVPRAGSRRGGSEKTS